MIDIHTVAQTILDEVWDAIDDTNLNHDTDSHAIRRMVANALTLNRRKLL